MGPSFSHYAPFPPSPSGTVYAMSVKDYGDFKGRLNAFCIMI